MDLVERTLDQFARDLRRLLGDNLLDIIAHGSYVLGDFRPNRGDLDYIVVTNADLGEATNAWLFERHDGYRSAKRLLLHQLEGTFYPTDFLRTLDGPFVGCYIGTGRRGWRTTTTLQNSYMDLKVAGKHGKHLLGTAVRVYKPIEGDILAEQETDLAKQLSMAESSQDLSTASWMSAVHWSARTMYYRTTGQVASKSQACRWARTVVHGHDLREVLSLAEGQRHPYEPEVVDDWVTVACRELLAHVGRLLRGTTGGELIPASTNP